MLRVQGLGVFIGLIGFSVESSGLRVYGCRV